MILFDLWACGHFHADVLVDNIFIFVNIFMLSKYHHAYLSFPLQHSTLLHVFSTLICVFFSSFTTTEFQQENTRFNFYAFGTLPYIPTCYSLQNKLSEIGSRLKTFDVISFTLDLQNPFPESKKSISKIQPFFVLFLLSSLIRVSTQFNSFLPLHIMKTE